MIMYSSKKLKAPEHQVAGHSAKEGRLGPLVDGEGRFFKPFQRDFRGKNEDTFYEFFSSNKNAPNHIHGYFPAYQGSQVVEASNGTGKLPHIVLEDVVTGYLKPSIMDIKIGSRTWYPNISQEYFKKCMGKDRGTTSVSLGFRISGFKIFDHEESSYWMPDKKVVHGYNVDEARLALRKFVSSNSLADSIPDCAFASEIYGGPNGILAQLLELKAWFETQTLYHLYSSSVLMFYENESVLMKGGDDARARVKLIDFAHSFDGSGVIDHNFLGGLCSFIKLIQDILESSDNNNETNIFQFKNGH